MSTSIGNMAVYVSADTGQAEKKVAGFAEKVDKFDRKMKAVGATEPQMKGLDAADRRAKRVVESSERREREHRRRRAVTGEGKKKGSESKAGQVVGDKLAGMSGLGEIASAGSAGGPWAAVAVAGLTAVTVAALGVKRALDLAGEAEANRVAFETLTGSAEKGKTLTAALDEYAAKTAFSARETAELGKQLLGVGVEVDQVMPAIRTFGDIAGTLGGDTTERMKRLTKAFGDVKANGRLAAEELNQFSEAGVNLGDALAKTMGKPRDEIKQLASEGEIGFGEVATALNQLVGPGGQFHKGADKMSGTWNGMLGQVGDATDRVFRDVGTALMEDLQLKDVLGEGLRVFDEFPNVLVEMRPGLKFFGDALRVGAKLFADANITAGKLSAVVFKMAKALFGPEVKAFGDMLAKWEIGFAALEKYDLAGTMVRGTEAGLDFLEPYALGFADWLDTIDGGLDQMSRTMKGIGDAAKGTFEILADGFKLLMDPLDNNIARMKLLGEMLANPLKVFDASKLLAEILVGLQEKRPDLKFKFPEAKTPPARRDEHANRKRVEEAFGAGREVIQGIKNERAMEEVRKEIGPVMDAMREVQPGLGWLADAVDHTTGRVREFADGLDAGGKKLSAGLREEAKKLTEQFSDPAAKLFKRLDDLDKMRQFGAIDDRTHAIAFGEAADKLMKGRTDPARLAPNHEYGSQEAARLTQQALSRNGTKDLAGAMRDMAEEQREAVGVAKEMLTELRRMPRPKVVKLGGE